MAFDEFKYRMLAGLFDLAGQVVSSQITKPNWDEQEKTMTDYYTNAKKVAKNVSTKELIETKQAIEKIVPQLEKKAEKISIRTNPISDLTTEKIESGTACVFCSKDHLSLASALLDEAYTFAIRPKFGMTHDEVRKRIYEAIKQILAMERMDLAPEQIDGLTEREKKIAITARNIGSDIRHRLNNVMTSEQLREIAAELSKEAKKISNEVFDLSISDGTIKKLCEGLKDEEREKCIGTITNVWKEKKENPL